MALEQTISLVRLGTSAAFAVLCHNQLGDIREGTDNGIRTHLFACTRNQVIACSSATLKIKTPRSRLSLIAKDRV